MLRKEGGHEGNVIYIQTRTLRHIMLIAQYLLVFNPLLYMKLKYSVGIRVLCTSLLFLYGFTVLRNTNIESDRTLRTLSISFLKEHPLIDSSGQKVSQTTLSSIN